MISNVIRQITDDCLIRVVFKRPKGILVDCKVLSHYRIIPPFGTGFNVDDVPERFKGRIDWGD